MRKTRVRKFVRKSSDENNSLLMSEMFEQFMLVKKGEGLAGRTLEEYYKNFDYFMRYTESDLTKEEMTLEKFMGWIEYMLDELDYSPHTVNIRVRTMRAFVRYCYEDKNWIEEPVHKRFKPIKAPIDNVDSFTIDEVKSLLAVVDDATYVGFRTKVIIYVLLDTMMRSCELLDVKRDNVDLKGLSIKLDAAETKTRTTRTVPLSPKTAKLLSEYMDETEEFESEYLFVSYEGKQLSYSCIKDNIKILGQIAGIKNKRVSPYVFRHTGALFYIMNNGDPFSLQKILGHGHMNMVRRYVQMTNVEIQHKHANHSPVNYVFKK